MEQPESGPARRRFFGDPNKCRMLETGSLQRRAVGLALVVLATLSLRVEASGATFDIDEDQQMLPSGLEQTLELYFPQWDPIGNGQLDDQDEVGSWESYRVKRYRDASSITPPIRRNRSHQTQKSTSSSSSSSLPSSSSSRSTPSSSSDYEIFGPTVVASTTYYPLTEMEYKDSADLKDQILAKLKARAKARIQARARDKALAKGQQVHSKPEEDDVFPGPIFPSLTFPSLPIFPHGYKHLSTTTTTEEAPGWPSGSNSHDDGGQGPDPRSRLGGPETSDSGQVEAAEAEVEEVRETDEEVRHGGMAPVLVRKLAKRPLSSKKMSSSPTVVSVQVVDRDALLGVDAANNRVNDDDDDDHDGDGGPSSGDGKDSLRRNRSSGAPDPELGDLPTLGDDDGGDEAPVKTQEEVVGRHPMFDLLREEVWVIPVLVASCCLAAVMGVFEAYLVVQAFRGSRRQRPASRRQLFLGQMLLLGLLMCAGMAVAHTFKPTVAVCSVLRVGTGLAYAVVYATLLVKLVFLVSLNSGVYLPATYQSLLLCFAILIQVVIGSQWLVATPAEVVRTLSPFPEKPYDVLGVEQQPGLGSSLENNGTAAGTTTAALTGPPDLSCNVTFQQYLLGMVYVIFLVVVVAVLAFKARGVRENYRESVYIGLSMVFAVAFLTVWAIAGLMAAPAHTDICLSCGLVATSAVVFVVMFMPKGRQLAAMGREGVYAEDRGDVYTGSSSATRSTGSEAGVGGLGGGDSDDDEGPPSGDGGTPSPSFFPIKPSEKLVRQLRDSFFENSEAAGGRRPGGDDHRFLDAIGKADNSGRHHVVRPFGFDLAKALAPGKQQQQGRPSSALFEHSHHQHQHHHHNHHLPESSSHSKPQPQPHRRRRSFSHHDQGHPNKGLPPIIPFIQSYLNSSNSTSTSSISRATPINLGPSNFHEAFHDRQRASHRALFGGPNQASQMFHLGHERDHDPVEGPQRLGRGLSHRYHSDDSRWRRRSASSPPLHRHGGFPPRRPQSSQGGARGPPGSRPLGPQGWRASSHGDIYDGGHHGGLEEDGPESLRVFANHLRSRFSMRDDLHAANELRASRADLKDAREALMFSPRGRSSRRSKVDGVTPPGCWHRQQKDLAGEATRQVRSPHHLPLPHANVFGPGAFHY